MEFNYDQILWETGSASGGTNGFGGYPARAGYSNGSGLEDTFYLPNGEKAEGNGQLIEALANIVRETGREVATPEEARKKLGIDN